jgi:nucleotide-binding universal stress UspA family protein
MKKILVPIDFSTYSMNALEVAIYIAKVKEMSIRLLHVVEDTYTPYYNMAGIGMFEDSTLFNFKKELQEKVASQLKEIADTKISAMGINVEMEVLIDNPRRKILNDINAEDIDLVVMGSHGFSGVEDIFIGGTSEKIIRTSSVPVITVQNIPSDYKINKIVFASDFIDDEVEEILNRVIQFAEVFIAELFLVRINTHEKHSNDQLSRERISALAAKFKFPAGSITTYADRNEEEGIVNYSKEIGADLITLCTHGRTGFARLFNNSIAEEVAGNSTVPVLTYNITKDKYLKSIAAVKRESRLGSILKTKKGKF